MILIIVVIIIINVIMMIVDKVLPVTCLHTRPVCGTAGTGLKKQNQQHSLFVLVAFLSSKQIIFCHRYQFKLKTAAHYDM